MPQIADLEEIGTLSFSSGKQVSMRVDEKCPGKWLRGLLLHIEMGVNVTNNGSAALNPLQPGTILDNLTLETGKQGAKHAGEANDWLLVRNPFFNGQEPYIVAEDTAQDDDDLEFYLWMPMNCPFHNRPWESYLDLREMGEIHLRAHWATLDSIITATTVAWASGEEPTITVYADYLHSGAAGTVLMPSPPKYFYAEGAHDRGGLGTTANTEFEQKLGVGDATANRGYTHIAVRAMDANTDRDHVAYGTTAINEIKLREVGKNGRFDYTPWRGDRLQRFMKMRYDRVYSSLSAVPDGIYLIERVGMYQGSLRGSYGVAGLEEFKVMIDHAGFANAGAMRILYGYVENLRQS